MNQTKIPKPILQPLGNNRFLLVKDLNCGNVKIPKGFITDGASIPRFFWRVLGSSMDTDRLWQAIRHDFRYQTQRITRKEADIELRDSLSGYSRHAIYWGVRAGGSFVWKRHTKTITENQPCEGHKEKKTGCGCSGTGCCSKMNCCWRARLKMEKFK